MTTKQATKSKSKVENTSSAKQTAEENMTANQYEIAVLYHPDLEVDLTKAEEKVKKIITEKGGKIVNIDNWGRKKLAYIIKKQDHAVYVFYMAMIAPENIAKIEYSLNITEEVIRYLITKPDLKAIDKASKLKAEKAEKYAESKNKEGLEDKDEDEE